MPRGNLAAYRNRFMSQLQRDERRGRETEDEALARLRRFDPSESVREANRAQFEDLQEDLTRSISDLRGSQVRRGRLDTGFAFGDEDELVSEAMEDFSRSASARSLDAANLGLGATRSLLGAGQATTNRYLDVLAGERDTQILLDNLGRQRKSRKAKGIGSLLGGGAGFLLGGPLGGLAGASIGSALGDIF